VISVFCCCMVCVCVCVCVSYVPCLLPSIIYDFTMSSFYNGSSCFWFGTLMNMNWIQFKLIIFIVIIHLRSHHSIFWLHGSKHEPKQPSRCSDSLRTAWSGDRIPVGARFSPSVQTSPQVQTVESLSREWSTRDMALTTHLHLAPMLKKEQSYISTHPLDLNSR